jgi:chemotaxis protein histidine kinase CheA/ActR/RegA family two-component response regulator
MLDAAQLTAIEQEVRTCFIFEDAPEYLAVLEQGILSLTSADDGTTTQSLPQWSELLRAAHSLKGGAALSQLSHVSRLSHRIEDLLQLLNKGQVQDGAIACTLLLRSVDEIRHLLSLAAKGKPDTTSSVLLPELEKFLATHVVDSANTVMLDEPKQLGDQDPVRIVLETDFLACLDRAKSQLQTATPLQIPTILNTLEQECQGLAEILNLRWLSERSQQIKSILAKPPKDLSQQAITLLKDLYTAREQFLSGKPSTSPVPVQQQPQTVAQAPQTAKAPALSPQTTLPDTTKVSKPLKLVAPEPSPSVEPTMRVPLRRLDYLSDTVGDLLISYERLILDQQRLASTSQDLKKRTRQFYQLRERIQTLYDQLLLPGQLSGQRFTQFDSNAEFDPLEMDRFTNLHSVLQDVQELLIRIEENNQDIEFLTKSTQDTSDRLRQQLGDLRTNLTEARMVPFATLAERFRRLIWDLNQRYDKSVRLQVRGSGILIDRAVLDQLYDPVLHLVRNAFDHGIELTQERLACGKPAEAQILLAASQQGTQVTITVADDGRGLDLKRVQQQAQTLGLLPNQLIHRSQLIQVLFTPGFSTADRVGELSGRGVGLDVVKAQLERLRGSVQVHTSGGKGTQFTLSVPMTLNILPLLLCQGSSNQAKATTRILAIPSVHITDLIEIPETDESQTIRWRDQHIPLLLLDQLLPAMPSAVGRVQSFAPSQSRLPTTETAIAIVLNVAGKPLALKASQLLSEREMVLKPFDDLVVVPAYFYGCTIMPNGEVVPVLAPDALIQFLKRSVTATPSPTDSMPVLQDSTPAPIALTSQQLPNHDIKILVADDSVAARRWLVRSLEQAGYQVIQCRDGQEAWDHLAAGTQCHLAIFDIEMPRLDGFQVLSQIRQHPKLYQLPVAMLTSRMGDRHIQRAKKLGANAYFTKPLGISQMLRSLDHLLHFNIK